MTEAVLAGTRQWQTEQVFRCPEQFYAQMLDDIHSARHSIIFNFYIFEYDSLGQRFCTALHEAAERGVNVRVVVDGIGSAWSAPQLARYFAETAVEFRIFHPLPWLVESYRWSFVQGNYWGRLSYLVRRINRRDHRKLVIIDNRKLWTGSFNISRVHLPATSGGDNWLDYGCRVTGEDVGYLSDMFTLFWEQRKPPTRWSNLANFRINFSARIRAIRNKKLLRQIHQARQRIWISAAYFAPTVSVIRALAQARSKGVDVRVLTAAKSDVPLFPALTASYFTDLLSSGIRIFSYDAAVLHAKIILIDDQCIMGSSNLNHRSFYHDLEVDIVLQLPDSLTAMQSFLASDMRAATEIKAEDTGYFSGRWLVGWLPRLLRYWM